MLAVIWHWWIGLALVLLSIVVVVAVVGAYIKAVSSQKHPGRKQKSPHHTDL